MRAASPMRGVVLKPFGEMGVDIMRAMSPEGA